jgi:hypothetical protein
LNGFAWYLLDHHIGNLNDGVLFWLGKYTLPSSAFNVEAENPEGCDVRPFALGFVGNEVVPCDVNLDLATGVTAYKIWFTLQIFTTVSIKKTLQLGHFTFGKEYSGVSLSGNLRYVR